METHNSNLGASLRQLKSNLSHTLNKVKDVSTKRDHLAKQVPKLQQQLKTERLARRDLENHIVTFKEEFSLKRLLYERDINIVRSGRRVEIRKIAGRLREQYQELMQTALQEMRIHYELKMQQNIFKRSHYVYCEGESDNNLNNLTMCVDDRLICCGYHSKLIEISQMNSINKIVKTFGLSDCNAQLIPADPFTRHSRNMINDEQL